MIYKELPRIYNDTHAFASLMRVALQFAYDGYGFYGYARQPRLRTIEGELLSLLFSQGVIDDVSSSHFRSASRTDKGVSALGNVVAFDTSVSEKHIASLYQHSSESISIYGYALVDDLFYPRYAEYRLYRYYLPRNMINVDLLLPILGIFTGRHDFSNFARVESGKTPFRTIENIVVGGDDECLWIDFYAQTFLWHQIRRIISAVLKCIRGKITKEDIQHALDSPHIPADFGLAPSEPLVLRDIVYKNITFYHFPGKNTLLSRIERNIKTRSINLFS